MEEGGGPARNTRPTPARRAHSPVSVREPEAGRSGLRQQPVVHQPGQAALALDRLLRARAIAAAGTTPDASRASESSRPGTAVVPAQAWPRRGGRRTPGGRRAARRTGPATGQSAQRGFAAVQTSAPSSITATAQLGGGLVVAGSTGGGQVPLGPGERRRRGARRPARAGEDAADVGVEHDVPPAEGEGGDRGGGVVADARAAPAARRGVGTSPSCRSTMTPRGGVQPQRPARVAEPAPGPHRLARRLGRRSAGVGHRSSQARAPAAPAPPASAAASARRPAPTRRGVRARHGRSRAWSAYQPRTGSCSSASHGTVPLRRGYPAASPGVLPCEACPRARADPCLRGSTGDAGWRCSASRWWSSSASARCSGSAATARRTRRRRRPVRAAHQPDRDRRRPPTPRKKGKGQGRQGQGEGRQGRRAEPDADAHPDAAPTPVLPDPSGPCADDDVYITPTVAAPIGGRTSPPAQPADHAPARPAPGTSRRTPCGSTSSPATTRSGSSKQCPDAIPTRTSSSAWPRSPRCRSCGTPRALGRRVLRPHRVGAARLLPRAGRRLGGEPTDVQFELVAPQPGTVTQTATPQGQSESPAGGVRGPQAGPVSFELRHPPVGLLARRSTRATASRSSGSWSTRTAGCRTRPRLDRHAPLGARALRDRCRQLVALDRGLVGRDRPHDLPRRTSR